LVSDPEATALVENYIAAGYDVTGMRFMNDAREDPAFGPFLTALMDVLEERSQYAARLAAY
jgi:hypothetical protein